LGYDVTVHDRNFDNLEKKVDVVMRRALKNYDPGIIVLVSGDGDFEPTIKESLDEGWTFET